jgi:hypothetical protein
MFLVGVDDALHLEKYNTLTITVITTHVPFENGEILFTSCFASTTNVC